MRIGVVINIDTTSVLPYLTKQEDIRLVENYCTPNAAPAVNTLIQTFLKVGNFVRVFTLAKKEFSIVTPKIEIYATTPYNIYPFRYLGGIFITARKLRGVIKDRIEDLDVLHAHWTYEYAYAAAAFDDKLPVFCTVRDFSTYIWKVESLKNKIPWTFKVFMNHLVFKHKKMHFIANSQYTAVTVKRKYEKDIPVIPNSIKSSFIKYGEHISPKKFTILCISSSNDKRKNIVTLLRAFQIFISKYPEAVLLLVGPPFVKSKTIKNWEKRNLLRQVELIGGIPREQIIEYIDRCSVFVTPSLEETFGNTLLESMVRKVPVIGGAYSGAVPYVLHHGKAGYLCDVSKADSLFRMMEHVFNNPIEANNKAIQAYTIILSESSEEKVCQEHLKLYKQCINKYRKK